jgi:DNA processing protein
LSESIEQKKGNGMESLIPWFTLKTVPGVGNHLFKRLMDRYGSPEAVLHADPRGLLRVDGVSNSLCRAINSQKPPARVEKVLGLVAKRGYGIVTMNDPEYPPLLLQIPDPPPLLYVNGKLPTGPINIAVVGSRNATDYGLAATRRLCAGLASNGVVIVSGMARGIDTAAHHGTMETKGKTIAVLGSGLERIYPTENRDLFHKIADNGAVISEFPLTAEPAAHHFPVRNRIISGMCQGTVVVEATRRSGSLITARLAAEQNREVFAVPGNIHSFKSTGTHTLIKQGAKLVEQAQDVLDELIFQSCDPIAPEKRSPASGAEQHELTAEESLVLEALGPYPMHIDDLVRKLSLDAGRTSSILLQLELRRMVSQTPGKFFSTSMD